MAVRDYATRFWVVIYQRRLGSKQYFRKVQIRDGRTPAVVEEPHPRLRDIYRIPPYEVSVENYEIHDRLELDYDTPTTEELRLIGWLTRWDVVNEYRKPKKMLTDKAVSRIMREAEACTR